MVAVDAALFISASVSIFAHNSLIDFFTAIGSHESAIDEFANIIWLTAFIVTLVSWGMLLTVRRFAREAYLIPGLLYLSLSIISESVSAPGIGSALMYAANVYFGIFISVLYFGPLSVLFKTAQQSDAPEPASPAR